MPRAVDGTYSLPPGTAAVSGALASSADVNSRMADLEADANTARPIVAGGTGASTAAGALTNLGAQPLDADLTSWAAIIRASGFDTFAATPSSANLRALLTDETGTGAAYFAGGDLGTPSAGVLTNATGLTFAGLAAAAVRLSSEGYTSPTDTELATTAWANGVVPLASAALAVGAVGTYALLQQTTLSTARSPGATLAGSSLLYSHVGAAASPGGSPAGTWRLMGAIPSSGVDETNTSLWLRIS